MLDYTGVAIFGFADIHRTHLATVLVPAEKKIYTGLSKIRTIRGFLQQDVGVFCSLFQSN